MSARTTPPPPYIFRPCTPSDLPTVALLLNYWIDKSIAVPSTTHRPISWWNSHFSLLRSKSLPFVLAITTSPLPPSPYPTFTLPTTPAETLLGYTYASPYSPFPGYECTIEPSVYVSPSARISGLGTALNLFLGLLLKFPGRYPGYGTEELVGEKRIRRYVGWTTDDREGVGKGKVRWFTEVMERDAGMKMTGFGPAKGVGRKWGKDVDLVWIWFDVEVWKPRGELGKEGEEDLKKLGWAGKGEQMKEKVGKIQARL